MVKTHQNHINLLFVETLQYGVDLSCDIRHAQALFWIFVMIKPLCGTSLQSLEDCMWLIRPILLAVLCFNLSCLWATLGDLFDTYQTVLADSQRTSRDKIASYRPCISLSPVIYSHYCCIMFCFYFVFITLFVMSTKHGTKQEHVSLLCQDEMWSNLFVYKEF